VPCPRCGADRVDVAGYCINCRLYRGPAQLPAQYPAYATPPQPARRNPLLIPGIIFGVVCVVLVGAVIVYALTSGGDETAAPSGADANPVVETSDTAAPTPADTPSATDDPSASASASAGPSASAAPCIAGVWLEEKHDEQVTVRNTGTFLFSGNGAYHRYSDTGRVVIDYGDGTHLRGSNGSTTFDYVFAGFISYQYKVANGVITYSSPRPDGTETFIRNGHTDYTGPLTAHVPAPQRVNCGSVAMSLTSNIASVQLKRTSPAP
jgi:hypothetical protein